jgi:hypothetical protein
VSTRRRIAFGCYVLVLLEPLAFGLTYLLRSEFMPYHALAVGAPWAQVPHGYQVLILALMRIAGGGFVALAVALACLLAGPFRDGAAWARVAIPAAGTIASGGALYGTLYVRANSDGRPPWAIVAGFMVLIAVAFVMSLEPRRDER